MTNIQRNYRYEPTRISELKIGDLVESHDVIFRITRLNNQGSDQYGTWKNFATEVVQDNSNGHFPKSWQKDYSIQSNDRILWSKVILPHGITKIVA